MRMEINLLPARSAPIRWLWPSATMQRQALGPLIGLAYVLSLAGIGALEPANVFLGALGFLDVYNERTRQFLRTFVPCIITGALYDSFRITLPLLIDGRIHVAGLYALDRKLFGVGGGTFNEVFARHHWAVADLLAGFAYLGYVAEYLGFALLLFFRGDTARARTFARGFLVVNVLGFITYIAYPAAPPWFVTVHGMGPAALSSAPSAAGALRFDALLGIHVFAHTYRHSLEVFGAVPSLHAAYPALAAMLVWKTLALRWARWPALGYALLVAASAVYLQHHYVIDVVLGVLYAAVTTSLVRFWEVRARERAALASPSHPQAERSHSRPSTTASDQS
jgi:membrane-associated phospholipid phosphatase